MTELASNLDLKRYYIATLLSCQIVFYVLGFAFRVPWLFSVTKHYNIPCKFCQELDHNDNSDLS